MAWVEDEINLPQVAAAMGYPGSGAQVYIFLAHCLKAIARESEK